VKVLFFLQDAIQSTDGAIVISHKGPLPRGAETPGTIRYFDDGKLVKEEKIKLPNAEGVLPPLPETDVLKAPRPCQLGTNLYAKDRRKGKTPAPATKAPAKTEAPAKPQTFEPDESGKKAAKAELNLLAQMVGGNATAEKLNIVNLFPDTSLSGGGGEAGAPGTKTAEVITFDQEDADVWSKQLAKQIGDLGLDSKQSTDDDDLETLMDKSGK